MMRAESRRYGEVSVNGAVSLPGSGFSPRKGKQSSEIVTAARKSLNAQGGILTGPSVLWLNCFNLPA